MILGKSFNMYYMQRGIFVFIAVIVMTTGAGAASVRGVSTASRTGNATVQNQTVNPASSYTYNYMYPYLNNDMRTTLKPYDATSQSTSPINAVVRTEQLGQQRRVVPRKNVTTVSSAPTTSVAPARSAVNTTATNGRRVVPRRNTTTTTQNSSLARATTRVEKSVFATVDPNASKMVSSSRCLADYAECMNRYCERTDTAYNKCYCSAKLAQIDAEYEPQIDELAKQIVALQYGNNAVNNSELNAYWTQVFAQYTGGNSWANLDDALNIDWASMESRVRGQNAFVTGHEYCIQHISGCFYMSSNLRDAYRSSIAKDCATYEAALNKLKTVAESVIEAYKE